MKKVSIITKKEVRKMIENSIGKLTATTSSLDGAISDVIKKQVELEERISVIEKKLEDLK